MMVVWIVINRGTIAGVYSSPGLADDAAKRRGQHAVVSPAVQLDADLWRRPRPMRGGTHEHR